MSRRVITPYDEGPTKDFLESLTADLGDSSDPNTAGAPQDQKKGKAKRKRHRTKSSADEGDKGHERGPRKGSESEPGPERMGLRKGSERQMSVSSDISLMSEEDVDVCGRGELALDCTGAAKVI